MKKVQIFIFLFVTLHVFSQNSDTLHVRNKVRNDVYLNCYYSPFFFSNIPKEGISYHNFKIGGKIFHSVSPKYKIGMGFKFAEYEFYTIKYDDDVRAEPVSSDAMQIQTIGHGISVANRILFLKDFYAGIDVRGNIQSIYKKYYIDYSPFYKYTFGEYKNYRNPSVYLDLALGYKFLEIQISTMMYQEQSLAPFYLGIGFQHKL